MMKLQKWVGRGNLPLQMKITRRDGEEHLSFRGTMMVNYAAMQIAKWIISGKEKVQPMANLVVILKSNLHGMSHYWIPGSINQPDADTVHSLIGDMPLMPENKQKIIYAHQIAIFNVEREDEEARSQPLAEIIHRPGGGSEIKLLYCSISEAAGLIYALQGLRTNDIDDGIVMQQFFSQVPLKKATPDAPENKVINFGTEEPVSEKDRKNAELIRYLEGY